jgi:transposase
MSPATVQSYVNRAEVVKLSWPLPDGLDDEALERLLFPHETDYSRRCPEPDFALIHLELKKKHVTKLLVWQEYREQHTDGMQYSQFCDRYRRWTDSLSVTMRQSHRAGERMFVDFSGDGLEVIDPRTGECKMAKLFVAVLGASNLTYVEPVFSEDLPTWIGCHVRAFTYFGGVVEIVVPDNLKSGVKRADFYDPELNPTYADLAQHYNTVVIPARKRKPRDKAKAEQGVLLAERWVLAVLRKREFGSLAELRDAVTPLRDRLNDRPMQKIGRSRRQIFEAVERAALKPLPSQPYEMCTWKKVTVNIDYHIEFEDHYYSVHYTYYTSNRRKMEVRATAATVEILHRGRRVASHVRSYEKYKHTTNPDHMPDHHRIRVEWSPSRIISWAKSVGPCTAGVIDKIMSTRKHPEQGYRSCLGILRLRDRYPEDRIERACERAMKYGTPSRKSIETILKYNRDRLDEEECGGQQALPWHSNVRGPTYYQ